MATPEAYTPLVDLEADESDIDVGDLAVGEGLFSVPIGKTLQFFSMILFITGMPTAVLVFINASFLPESFDTELHQRSITQFNPRIASIYPFIAASVLVLICLIVWKLYQDGCFLACSRSRRKSKHWFTLGCTSIIIVASLPLVTFASTALWWTAIFDGFVDCSAKCAGRSASSSSSNSSSSNSLMQEACLQVNISTAIAQAYLPENYEDLLDTGFHCKRIFKSIESEGSLYVKTAVEKGYRLFAFEALARKYYNIPVVDIYWSLPMGVVLAMWVSIAAALEVKLRELVVHREIYVQHNMLSKAERGLKYFELFKYLFAIHLDKGAAWYPDSAAGSNPSGKFTTQWLLSILHDAFQTVIDEEKSDIKPDFKDKTLEDRDKLFAEEAHKILVRTRDDDGDGQTDALAESQASGRIVRRGSAALCRCSTGQTTASKLCKSKPGAALAVVLCALIHIGCPVFYRAYLFFLTVPREHAKSKEITVLELERVVMPCGVLGMPLMVNAVVTFVTIVSVAMSVINAYNQYNKKYHLLSCFDCLWRFPGENPIQMIGDEEFRNRIQDTCARRDKHNEKYSGLKKDTGFWSVWMWRDQFRLDFMTRNERDATGQVMGINSWFIMRSYLMMDAVDERISLEMWSLLSALLFLPSLVMVITNFLVMQGKVSGHSNVVNVQVLFDLAVFFIVLSMVMALTLKFNTKFEHHVAQVRALKDHLNMIFSHGSVGRIVSKKRRDGKTGSLPISLPSRDASKASDIEGEADPVEDEVIGPEDLREITQFIDAIISGMQTFDKPATLFGFQIDTAVLGRFTTLGAGLATTQLYPIIMQFLGTKED